MMDKHIIPECYIDTTLVETLVPTKSGYNHQKGCNNVVKIMIEKKELSDGFALGIVDEDKKILKYISEFRVIADEAGLKLLKHTKKHHYIIYIVPAVEKWILENAKEVNIDLKDYDLPDRLSELLDMTKVQTNSKNKNFKKLFQAIQQEGASGFVLLTKWIHYLKAHPYNADLVFFTADE
jgi:hypothetical protein